MFYRQKVLLALLQLSGGELGNTDLQKSLFLFCQDSGAAHYDFFPHRFGPYSFTIAADKEKLMGRGVLANERHWVLAGPHPDYPAALRPADVRTLRRFFETRPPLGRPMLDHIYRNFPDFAVRSKIAADFLTPEQQAALTNACPATEQGLFTIGYEGRSIDAFLHRLLAHDVRILVDVRRNPLSRKHGFSKRRLADYLQRVGVRYVHLPGLGIQSQRRRELQTRAEFDALFEAYARETLPQKADDLDRIRHLVQKEQRVALTCFEADPLACHRHKITEKLSKEIDFPIIHL